MSTLGGLSLSASINAQLKQRLQSWEEARLRYHELKRRDYFKTTRTICFCSDHPDDSEFARSILSKRFYQGRGESLDRLLLPMVAATVGQAEETVYANRARYNTYWDNFAAALHQAAPEFVFSHALAAAPVLGGLRSRESLKYGVEQGLINYVVWIESDRAKTVKRSKSAVTRKLCDFAVTCGPNRLRTVHKIEKLGKLFYSNG